MSARTIGTAPSTAKILATLVVPASLGEQSGVFSIQEIPLCR
ncbi:hypothetical protein [Nocardia altamirensis]|nr:hypothetical protein [Nocardia altamirensis]